MRPSRTDLLPVLTIMTGGVIGASLSFSFLGSRSGDVPTFALAAVVAPVPPVPLFVPVPPPPMAPVVPVPSMVPVPPVPPAPRFPPVTPMIIYIDGVRIG